MNHNFILDLLFWLHILIIISGVLMGLILPLPLVLGVVILHRLQFIVFNDCLLSKYQKKLQGISQRTHFLQFAVKKIFKRDINDRQSHWLDYLLISLTITIAVLNTIF